MFATVKYWWDKTKLARNVISVLAFVGLIASLVSIVYYDYMDHREWATLRIAEGFDVVKDKQGSVAQIALKTVPSKATKDKAPDEPKRQMLIDALVELSTSVGSVEVNDDEMERTAEEYRESIASFVYALVNFDEDVPSSYSELQRAAVNWDITAKAYTDMVGNRIQSYRASLVPSS